VVQACASASASRASAFGEAHGVPARYRHDSHESFLSCPDTLQQCDIVHVSSLNHQHRDQVLALIAAGKNVLCEKPMGMNLLEVEEMQRAADAAGVFLGEGMWTRFFPAVKHVKELIRSNAIGEVVSAHCDFSFASTPLDSPRLWRVDLGGGGLLDVGCYVLAMVDMCFRAGGYNVVQSAKSSASAIVKEGVDVAGGALLAYEKEKGDGTEIREALATCAWGIAARGEETCFVAGTKGSIKIVSPMHCPDTVVVTDASGASVTKTFALPPAVKTDAYHYRNSRGLIYEANAAAECLRRGDREFREFDWDDSRRLVRRMDDIRDRVGVKYPEKKRT
jgi:dihydrodiol dehydrogenase / D-xylose 1-dehydrogenase (NADP)